MSVRSARALALIGVRQLHPIPVEFDLGKPNGSIGPDPEAAHLRGDLDGMKEAAVGIEDEDRPGKRTESRCRPTVDAGLDQNVAPGAEAHDRGAFKIVLHIERELLLDDPDAPRQ